MRTKIGNIFEIDTGKGKAYLHYILRDKSIGDLVRVLPGLYADTPANLDEISGSEEMFLIFFPVTAALNRKIVKHVGYREPECGLPKYMRSPHTNREGVEGWHIVDTETMKREFVKTLTPDQKKYSPFEIWNDTLLIEMLNDGWNLESWV